MDGNPEGTPNPLNPTPGTASAGNEPQPSVDTAAGAGIVNRAESVMPASFAQNSSSTTITGMTVEPKAEEPEKPAEAAAEKPTEMPVEKSAQLEKPAPLEKPVEPVEKPAPVVPKFTAPRPMSHRGGAVDPMMRRTVKPQLEQVDTFEMTEQTIDELRPSESVSSQNPQGLVAKDSIVESTSKNGKKKALVICGIVLLMAAIICGAAAIAVAIVNNNGGDRVSKAIERLVNGEMPTIVTAQGKISVATESFADNSEEDDGEIMRVQDTTSEVQEVQGTADDVQETDVYIAEVPTSTSTTVDFNGTFDLASPVNKVSATVTATYDNNEFTVDVNEIQTKDGDVFFKLSGLSDIVNAYQTPVTNCVDGEGTNCSTAETSSTGTAATMLTAFAGLFETIDDEWILASGDFKEVAGSLNIFDNTSTCLINALGTLPQYSKDLANKYKANQFITYSNDNLKISKKKNDLYRLGINNEKMSAFVNSLGNNGFINELNACVNGVATNTATASELIQAIFSNFPTIYVEVDENYNFTRIYFDMNAENNGASSTAKADINLSYPGELKVTAPEEYLNMSTVLSTVMGNLFTTGDTVTITEEVTE